MPRSTTSTSLTNDIKLVWIATMPRSGSMWAYNVTRSVLQRAGRDVFPKNVPQTDREMFALAEQGLRDRTPTNVWAIKVHHNIKHNIPRSRIITTQRDPRDALISYRRFMQCSFECALKAMTRSTRACDYYQSFPKEFCLRLEYNSIVKSPSDVVTRISEHIGCPIPSEVALEISIEFSKANIKRRIQNTEARLRHRASLGNSIAPGEVVQLGPQNQRAFDLTTGFQSGHVSEYQEGDWKHSLTAAEKDRMLTVLGPWLRHNGYPDSGTPDREPRTPPSRSR